MMPANPRGKPMSDIDWKVELRNIEREFDGLPPLLGPNDLRVPGSAEKRAKGRPLRVPTTAGAALRLSLVIALAAGVAFWPYPHACGLGLFAFLGVEMVVLVGGLWTIVYTWRGRLARAHAVAMLLVLWGLVLLAAEVLPRVGYARTAAPVSWMCTAATP
jgi:hypothetical protein